ncbi:hypothetical protein SAMN05216327_101235 [Dyadobacter sp. SG02]|uniref:helix-turn-helix domain-containing protein n=1 Tax=Dyadobacter sp. SG02 TaxID=1855291 RepID=UPI0008BB2FEB|nr:helix-turn-helix transcriptional regulator [Dyadobacter sp. SG02]SEI39870.1 hypothetical protein SAMN05216327_101235 [Dyadobacter sp. SG02]
MSTKKLPIGMAIKAIIQEKNLRPQDIAAKLRISRQNIYLIYSRQEMSSTEQKKWAAALEVSLQELANKREISSDDQPVQNANYLMEQLANIEMQFREFREQLQVKDNQIASLQRMLEMTLGKSEDVIIFKTTPVLPIYPGLGALEA